MSTGLGVDLGASDNSRAFLDGRRDRVDLRTAIGDLSRFCLCWVGVGDTGREFVWCGMGLELMQDSYTIVLMLLLMLCCYLEERGGKERL